MMKENRETGKIIEMTNEGLAKVLVERKKMCSHCPSRGVCNPPEEGKQFTIEVENPMGAVKGDTVEIGIERSVLLVATFWIYFVPAVFFLAGVSIGFIFLARYITFVGKEFLGLIVGIVFLMASFLILRSVNNRLGKKKSFKPTIVRISPVNNKYTKNKPQIYY